MGKGRTSQKRLNTRKPKKSEPTVGAKGKVGSKVLQKEKISTLR